MNKIYRVIWNKAKGCYVVTSEFAKRHTKSAQSVVVGAIVASAMVLGSMGVEAAIEAGNRPAAGGDKLYVLTDSAVDAQDLDNLVKASGTLLGLEQRIQDEIDSRTSEIDRVDKTLDTTINDHNGRIAANANSITELSTALDDKVSTEALTTALADKVSTEALTTALADKVSTEALTTALADKADKASVEKAQTDANTAITKADRAQQDIGELKTADEALKADVKKAQDDASAANEKIQAEVRDRANAIETVYTDMNNQNNAQTELINANKKAIDDEVDRAGKAEEALKTDVKKAQDDASAANEKIQAEVRDRANAIETVYTDMNNQNNAQAELINTNKKAIDDEAARAAEAESGLQENIDTLGDTVAANQLYAETAITNIGNSLNDINTKANQNAKDIADEAARAAEAESGLQENIDTLGDTVAANQLYAETAITNIGNSLNDINTKANQNAKDIADETTARQEADQANAEAIQAVADSMTKVFAGDNISVEPEAGTNNYTVALKDEIDLTKVTAETVSAGTVIGDEVNALDINGSNINASGVLKVRDLDVEQELTSNKAAIEAEVERSTTKDDEHDSELADAVHYNEDGTISNGIASDRKSIDHLKVGALDVDNDALKAKGFTVDDEGLTSEVEEGTQKATMRQRVNEILYGVTDGTNSSSFKQTAEGFTLTGKTAVEGDLDVTGETNLKKTNVDGELNVTGETNLKKTNVDGELNVTGETNLKKTNVDGDLTVTGEAKAGKLDVADGKFIVDDNGFVSANEGLWAKSVTSEQGSFNKLDTVDLTATGETNLKDTTVDGKLDVTGDTSVGGKLDVTGDTQLNGGLKVMGFAEMMDNLGVRGNLEVDGTSTFKDDVIIADGKNLTVGGNATVKKDLTVEGKTNLKDTNVDGDLTVTGEAKASKLNVANDKFIVDETGFVTANEGLWAKSVTSEQGTFTKLDTVDLTATGKTNLKDTTVDGKLDVTGDTNIDGKLNVTGDTTLNFVEVLKDLGVHGDLTAYQNATVKKDLTVEGETNLKNTKVDGKLDVTGDASVGGKLDVTGDVTMNSNATVKKNLTVEGETNLKNTKVDGTLTVGKEAIFEDTVTVKKDLKVNGNANVDGDVTAKSYKVGEKTYIDDNGINANNQKITNVADGRLAEDSFDAVNGRQLHETNKRVERLDNRVDKLGANAAALANLHPMDFDKDSKLSVAAAVGNYRDENAVALGMFYQPTERVMINLSGTVGNSENMVGGGVSFKLGRISKKVEADALNTQVQNLQARMDALLSVINPKMSKDFPDVPENHWAYDAVSKLAGNGIVEGYEDGKFHGERTMSRYEMAEIIYNALAKGAKAEAKLVEEFKPELQALAAKKTA